MQKPLYFDSWPDDDSVVGPLRLQRDQDVNMYNMYIVHLSYAEIEVATTQTGLRHEWRRIGITVIRVIHCYLICANGGWLRGNTAGMGTKFQACPGYGYPWIYPWMFLRHLIWIVTSLIKLISRFRLPYISALKSQPCFVDSQWIRSNQR